VTVPVPPPAAIPDSPSLKEQHFTIRYGEVGHSYDSIVGPYLVGAKEVVVEDPYIRMTHQVQNLVRFCEAVVKAGSVKKIKLITGYDDEAKLAEVQEKILELQQSLADADVVLETSFNTTIHDREIRVDNGWVIKIGRGLDFYQKPGGWFEIGATDLSMRKCLETKVDIFRNQTA
jgi:ATP-dependent Lon protease